MLLSRFAVPGNIAEISEPALDAWSDVVSAMFDEVAALNPRLYNPTVVDTPSDRAMLDVTWPASPGTLLRQQIARELRWAAADATRDLQDEYCEWSVLRDSDGRIQRVTFTSETGGYYEHLLEVDEERLLDLYSEAVGRVVDPAELKDANGFYKPDNPLNARTDGTIVHLSQGNNTLGAAVRLAGDATVLREDANGLLVVHPEALVNCGGLGVATRHSDPAIASAVNKLVADGFDITLADPPGLYIDSLTTTGMQTPDGADAADFWTIERGDADHAVRARFEVPEDRGFRVGDIRIGGRRIEFGAQLADRLQVRLTAVAKRGAPAPPRQPCV